MSKRSDKLRVAEEIVYLRRVVSGLRHSIRSVDSQTRAIDAEILALAEKRERIRADSILAPTLLPRALQRLADLEALDFLSLSTSKARATPREKMKAKMLKLKLELETISSALARFDHDQGDDDQGDKLIGPLASDDQGQDE